MSGLEVIGSIASVMQLAGAVCSISIQLHEVANALSNAPADIKDLAHDLEIFSEELALHSKLVNTNNSRYSDQVNRLTAKIIGRCATICEKIDKILKKLRNGSVLSRLKWMYKEKEIRRLLERLRDLKLSLMGTLSLLRTLKADHMMDAMGVQAPSFLQGPPDERLSRETVEEVENTRRKLERITIHNCKAVSLCSLPLTSQSNLMSHGLDQAPGEMGHHGRRDFSSTSPIGFQSPACCPGAVEQAPTISPMPVANLTEINTVMQNPDALGSVQSFHSALSYQEYQLPNSFDTTSELESAETRAMRSNSLALSNQSAAPSASDSLHTIHGEIGGAFALAPLGLGSYPISFNPNQCEIDSTMNSDHYRRWKKDVEEVTAKHFNLTRKDAQSLVSSIPLLKMQSPQDSSTSPAQEHFMWDRSEPWPVPGQGYYQLPTPQPLTQDPGKKPEDVPNISMHSKYQPQDLDNMDHYGSILSDRKLPRWTSHDMNTVTPSPPSPRYVGNGTLNSPQQQIQQLYPEAERRPSTPTAFPQQVGLQWSKASMVQHQEGPFPQHVLNNPQNGAIPQQRPIPQQEPQCQVQEEARPWPIKLRSVRSRSKFSPIDESPFILPQHPVDLHFPASGSGETFKGPAYFTERKLNSNDLTSTFVSASPNLSVDPLILHPPYAGFPSTAVQSNEAYVYSPLPQYPPSPSFSQMSRAPRPVKQGGQSFYPSSSSSYGSYPYSPPRRPSLASQQSDGRENGNFSSEESKEKGRCTYPKCGKLFKDLNAHMLREHNGRSHSTQDLDSITSQPRSQRELKVFSGVSQSMTEEGDVSLEAIQILFIISLT